VRSSYVGSSRAKLFPTLPFRLGPSEGTVRDQLIDAAGEDTELELSRRNWTEAKSEAFAPPFLCWRFPGSILPSRFRFRSLSGGPDPAGGAGLDEAIAEGGFPATGAQRPGAAMALGADWPRPPARCRWRPRSLVALPPLAAPAVKAVVGRRVGTVSTGQSRQRAPDCSMCTIPLMTRRSSTRYAPRRPWGRSGSIRANSASLSQ